MEVIGGVHHAHAAHQLVPLNTRGRLFARSWRSFIARDMRSSKAGRRARSEPVRRLRFFVIPSSRTLPALQLPALDEVAIEKPGLGHSRI